MGYMKLCGKKSTTCLNKIFIDSSQNLKLAVIFGLKRGSHPTNGSLLVLILFDLVLTQNK